MQTQNLVGWFEIPVDEMDRAVRFYESVLGVELERHRMGPLDMAWFPAGDGTGAPGALVRHPDFYRPSADGVLIYLSAPSGDLSNELTRVEDAGGAILVPRRQISDEHGYMAVLQDTEGNRIALHSRP